MTRTCSVNLACDCPTRRPSSGTRGIRACGESTGTRASPLSAEQRQENRVLAHLRQGTRHVIRRMESFRVLQGTYRHRRRQLALRVQLIAALCNLIRAHPA
ncbi:transposase family protein [Deinococcus oregonensis]|uniref:Transposase family protein n=1 Tax=Deinococcus oregonensis TaxID=1805970 RepID=A0ABV6B2P0_9DEIO